VVFSILLVRELRKTAPPAARGSFNKALAAMRAGAKYKEWRLTIMCVIIVMVFVGCNSFYVIYYILEGLKTSINDVLIWRANDQYIHSTARVFAIINSSINVFIYGVFNKKFKTTFCSLFWKCSAQNKDVPSGNSGIPLQSGIINTNSKDGLSSKKTNILYY